MPFLCGSPVADTILQPAPPVYPSTNPQYLARVILLHTETSF
ncbi:MAG TPA: hypothetical protein PK299_12440 [Anaerolineales bacterium]|nr:hypothetical protein [Anaerolineales bacterium]